VETPVIIGAPAPEPHIDPVIAKGGFLQTSPELCMKRLLARGFPRVYQIARCFRDGERGDRHLPEFTMLEWYRAGIGYRELMEECVALVRHVAMSCGLGEELRFSGHVIALGKSWEIVTVDDAFKKYTPLCLEEASSRGLFDQYMVEHIEPHLGISVPTILCEYPASTASLARPKAENPQRAERFEVYVGGLELANGFSELTDPVEQRKRFIADLKTRRDAGKAVGPMPEEFLSALSDMPEAAGIALGVDRLVMLMGDYPTIDEVVAFTPEEIAG
jgi:lysyl-tRNA synthetase class 2